MNWPEDFINKVICGDCLEILPMIPDGVIDAVITDPPYGVSYETARRSPGDKLRTPIQNDGDLSLVAKVWPIIIQTMKPNCHWYAFASPSKIVEAAGIYLGYKHIIAWDKGNRGTVGDLTCGFGEAWEAIFFGGTGRRPINGKRPRTIVRHDWSSADYPVHPTVKPVPLIERMIGWSSNPGDIILDPFAGSGTTLIAAKQLGRKYIGIEINKDYCRIAEDRLRQEELF